MLQLRGTLRNASSGLSSSLSRWRTAGQQQPAAASCSGVASPGAVLTRVKEERPTDETPKARNKKIPTSANPMVKRAFDTLKLSKSNGKSSSESDGAFETRIKLSGDVGGLLKMVEERSITRENAHAAVSLLIDWVNGGRAKLDDFELDTRFLRLCDLLSRSAKNSNGDRAADKAAVRRNEKQLDQLNFFYGADETSGTSKQVANLSVQQMIKIMRALAQQKRRTTPLLRSLAFNINRSGNLLDVKQSSDLLYSMAVLNYPDEVLLEKVSSNLVNCIKETDKSPVIGSIATSLGLLRYKNEELTDVLSEWMVRHSRETRPQDAVSFFLTLATLGYRPANVDALKKELAETLRESEMTKPMEWLDVVWALMVLQLADKRHVASVLNPQFVEKLAADSREIPVPKKHKLLNINGIAASLLANDEYDGPLLKSDSDLLKCPIHTSKEKQVFARSVIAAVDNMFPSPRYSKTNVDLGAGFLLDAEFCVDSAGKRLEMDADLLQTKGFRIAVMVLSYNDFCRGKQDLVGYYDLQRRVLRAKGYKTLAVPYTEFSTEDKIVQRILYIQNQINKIIAE